MNLTPCQEIALSSFEDAMKIMEALTHSNYVVMLSREESLYIINYLWSPCGSRNDVVFMSREQLEEGFFEKESE